MSDNWALKEDEAVELLGLLIPSARPMGRPRAKGHVGAARWVARQYKGD